MKKVIFSVLTVILSITIYAQSDINEQIMRHFKRAETAYKMENYKDAIKEFEQVIKLNPKHADAYYNLATICEKLQADHEYLRRAIEYYKKYAELVPAEKEAITDKIYELEYIVEKKVEDQKHFESVLGTWKTTTYDYKTGKPDCMVEITPLEGKLRLKLSPNSSIYSSTFTNIVATAQLYKESLLFTYTDDKTYVPNPAKWDALATFGNIAGGVLSGLGLGGFGDIASQAITAGTQVGANAGRASSTGKNTRKFYDFKIFEFGEDTLKGYLHHFSDEKDFRTNNTQILADEVRFVDFIRGTDLYPKVSNPAKPKKTEIQLEPRRVIPTLGINYFVGFLNYKKYDFRIYDYEVSSYFLNHGTSINLNLLFVAKKSLNKKTKYGLSLSNDLLIGRREYLMSEGCYRDSCGNIKGIPAANYYFEKATIETYCSERSFSWSVRSMMGFSGISRIGKNVHLNWDINPVGIHFTGYTDNSEYSEHRYTHTETYLEEYSGNYYTRYMYDKSTDSYIDNNWDFGLCGSVDLGFSYVACKKLAIAFPYIRFSYALDSKFNLSQTLPLTFQTGIAFTFFGDASKSKKNKQ